MLDEYWSEVSTNHRAFLQDADHGVFFIPGGQGGYIFSYKGDDLSLKKAVSGYSVKRAIFLDDYFYVIGNQEIVVFDESDWSQINSYKIR